MWSLAIGTEDPMPPKTGLLDTALWRPVIPPSDVDLNCTMYDAGNPLATGYKPLCWTLFGGPAGNQLANLIEVDVTMRSSSLHSIGFLYNTDDISRGYRRFGGLAHWTKETVSFAIDGPGGEFIESVEMEHLHYDAKTSCRLRSLKASPRCWAMGSCADSG